MEIRLKGIAEERPVAPHVGLAPHGDKISPREKISDERFDTVISQVQPMPSHVKGVAGLPVTARFPSDHLRSLHQDKSTPLEVIGRRQAREARAENEHRRLSRRMGHARHLYQVRDG